MKMEKNIFKVEISELAQIIPKLTSDRHKGQNGKIAVIGGSKEYTGAPYYAGITALRGGCDLIHVFCTESAGIPVKSYSPELIVHNSLPSTESFKESEFDDTKKEESVKKATAWFDSIHSFVIGPGLGRDPILAKCLPDILNCIKDECTVLFDGDMLWYLSDSDSSSQIKEVLKKIAKWTVLTPNKVEFSRLWKAFTQKEDQVADDTKDKAKQELKNAEGIVLEVGLDNAYVADAVKLSKGLHNVTIFQKEEFDIATDGKKAYVVKQQGALKRSGGQGDILSGLMGVYIYWNSVYSEKEKNSDDESRILKGCVFASVVAKKAGNIAFEKHKYSLTTPTVIEHVSDVIDGFYTD